MFGYIVKRLLTAIPTLIGVSLLVFSMVHLAPGDPAMILLGEKGSAEALEEIRKAMGLDKPLYQQYFIFVENTLSGDFGTSFKSKELVLTEFMDRFPATIELAFFAMLIAVVIGVGAGIIAAVKRYSIFDYASMFISLTGVSMPIFWLGLLMIYFFAVNLEWLPVSGRMGYEFYVDEITGFLTIDTLLQGEYEAFWDVLRHLVMPSIALATIPMSILARITRASMLEVMDEEYIRTARAKGCAPLRVVMIHALRNALIPVITIIGLMMGTLLGGAVLTESIFSWPGIGKWLVNAVFQRDYPVIQFTILIIASMFVMVNLLVDLVYALINPKIRLS